MVYNPEGSEGIDMEIEAYLIYGNKFNDIRYWILKEDFEYPETFGDLSFKDLLWINKDGLLTINPPIEFTDNAIYNLNSTKVVKLADYSGVPTFALPFTIGTDKILMTKKEFEDIKIIPKWNQNKNISNVGREEVYNGKIEQEEE